MDRLSSAIADLVTAASIERGSLIGLSVPNGPGFIAGFLGLRRAGQAPVMLDSSAPDEDRRRTMTALGAAAVLSCTTGWPTSAGDFRLSRVDSAVRAPAPPDVAVVKLTSGSTGAPRGVALREEELLADEDALARTMGFRDTDRLLSVVPLSHSYGFTTLTLSAVVRGLTLVLPAAPGPFAPLDAARVLGATIFPTVPAYLQALLKVSQPPSWPTHLRRVISAGAMLPSQTAARFREVFGQPVHAFYGSSECGGICYDREGGGAERGVVGTPVEGVRISLAPIRSGDPTAGLVTVESAAVGSTYLPDRDRRLADGRFETMDVATWQGGELALQGRVDRVINLRGRKVDPSEVERVIAELDGVAEAVVIAVASADGGAEVVQAVVASTADHLDYRRVAAWCRTRLAEHKVPRRIVFVDAIPRTSRGKVDLAALLELARGKATGAARG